MKIEGDHESGRVSPLTSYAELFPGEDDLVARWVLVEPHRLTEHGAQWGCEQHVDAGLTGRGSRRRGQVLGAVEAHVARQVPNT